MIRALLMLLALLMAQPLLAEAGFDPFGEAGIDDRPGALVPLDAPLIDSQGRPTTLRALAAGKPIVLVPVLHNCPNICGVTLAGVADAVANQSLRPGRDFALVAFGIDPREAPRAAADDLERMRARAPRQQLQATATVGSDAAIHSVTRAIGYRYAWDKRIGQYAHIAATAVLTPQGRLAGWLYGLTPSAGELNRAISEASKGKPAPLTERILLLCFHYDPETGRYTASIMKLLRVAGMATLLGIGVLVWRLRRARV